MRRSAITRACVAAAVLVTVGCDAGEPASAAAVDAARKRDTVQVVTLSKQLDAKPISEDFLARSCRDWKLTEADVRRFFASADPLTSEEHHSLYYVLPCKYSGSIYLDDQLYEFEINAGSYGTLRRTSEPGRITLYGCKRRCEKLFPFAAYDDE